MDEDLDLTPNDPTAAIPEGPIEPEPSDDNTPTAPAASSAVGHRDPGDTTDIGGTDAMTAETGGLAGTSR